MRDETGWKLSTTRAAAQPDGRAARLRLGRRQRRGARLAEERAGARQPAPCRRWSGACAAAACANGARLRDGDWAAREAVHGARPRRSPAGATQLPRARPAANGWPRCAQLLQRRGQWEALRADAAGMQGARGAAAGRGAPRPSGRRWPHGAAAHGACATSPPGSTRCWKARSFVPPHAGDEQVVMLPHEPVAGPPVRRRWCCRAATSAACPPRPSPPAGWTQAQREPAGPALARGPGGRAARRRGAARCRRRWWTCSGAPATTAASRCCPARWCRRCALRRRWAPVAADPRAAREEAAQPVAAAAGRRPRAGARAAVRQQPTRTCAAVRTASSPCAAGAAGSRRTRRRGGQARLRQLAARACSRPSTRRCASAARCRARSARRLLDAIAARRHARAQRLGEGEFLPFAAAWPPVRDGYLRVAGSARGAPARVRRGPRASTACSSAPLTLAGRIDRIDRLRRGPPLVMDYKTEGLQATTRPHEARRWRTRSWPSTPRCCTDDDAAAPPTSTSASAARSTRGGARRRWSQARATC